MEGDEDEEAVGQRGCVAGGDELAAEVIDYVHCSAGHKRTLREDHDTAVYRDEVQHDPHAQPRRHR